MSEVVKIKTYVNTGYEGCGHEDIIEVDKDDWDAMTEDEQQLYLDTEAQEFMGGVIDFGAYVIKENDS